MIEEWASADVMLDRGIVILNSDVIVWRERETISKYF